MRTLCWIWAWSAILLVGGCKSDERELKAKADFLCRFDALADIELKSWPDAHAVGDYVHAEDLAVLREEASSAESESALGQMLSAGLAPVMKAATAARAQLTTCTVDSVVIEGDKARVTVTASLPVMDAPLEKLGTLGKLPSHEERVEQARKWFEEGGQRDSRTTAAVFRRTPDGWRRFFDKAGEREAQRRSAMLEAAGKEVTDLLQQGRYRLAKEKLQELQQAHAGAAELEAVAAVVEAQVAEVIAGDWKQDVETDPMTDDRNVYVLLKSDNEISGGFDRERPTLIARCSEKKSAFFIVVGTTIDSDYGEYYDATGRIRFGDDKAQRIRFGIGDNRDSVFLKPTKKWLDVFQNADGKQVNIEVPTYRTGDQVIRFDLTGTKQALQSVRDACNI